MVSNLTHQNHEHFTGVVLKTQMSTHTHTHTHTKMHNLLAAGNFRKDEHGNITHPRNITHPTHGESTSCTKGKPTKNIKWQKAIWWTAVLQNWWSCFSPPASPDLSEKLDTVCDLVKQKSLIRFPDYIQWKISHTRHENWSNFIYLEMRSQRTH